MRFLSWCRQRSSLIASTVVVAFLGSLFVVNIGVSSVSAACAPSVFVGYNSVNAYDASSQTVIDLNGATAGTSASVGGNTTYDMTATPDGSKLFVGTGAGIAVMDTATNVVTRITTTGTIWAVVVNSTGTTAYATNNSNNRIDVVDVATNTVTSSIALSAAPSAMAIKPDDSQLWIRFNYVEGIAIIDTATQTVLDGDTNAAGTQFFFAGSTTSTVNTGQGIDFNPNGTRAVVSNFSNGTISFINTVTMQMVDVNGASAGLNTPTVGSQSIRRVKYSPDGLRIFAMLTSPTFYVRVYLADMSAYTDVSQVNYPHDIAFLPNGKFAVANFGGSLSFFSSSGNDSSWGGTYTRDADVTFSNAHAIEYGCASSLVGATTTTTTSTTTTTTTSTTVAPTSTTTPSTTVPATTSTTVAPQSTTTLPTAATVPLVSSTTTSVRPTSTSSSSTSTTSTTVLMAASSTTTSSTEAPTTTISAAEAVEQFIGVTVEDVDKIADVAENERGSALFIGGKAVKVDTETTLDSYTMAYLDAAVKVECFDRDGKSINLSADSRFEVRRGDRVKVTVVGFKPGSIVKVAIFSDPTALGSIEADINGDGLQQWVVPDSLSAGTHTLVTSGDLSNVKDAVFGLRVIVDNPSFVTRVATSTATRVILALGVLFGLLIPATRRRRRDQTRN